MKINNGSVNSIELIGTKSGDLSLRVESSDGLSKTIHSAYDPLAEAKTVAAAFSFDGKGILIVLGLGLGYHVKELEARFPDAEIIVVEASPEIVRYAEENGAALSKKTKVLCGISPEKALEEITRHQMEKGIPPLSVFSLIPAVSAFADYYRPIRAALENTTSLKLWDRLRYPKFSGDTVRAVLIDSGYFLVKEVEKAMESLGHKIVRLSLNRDESGDSVVSRLISAVVDFRPDFVITMNHLGFDEDGALASLLKSIELPVASWYVDSPRLIVKAFERNVSPFVSLFLWDRSYIREMNEMGFEDVSYLPLATDETLFRPVTARKHRKKLQKYSCETGFVGNSMIAAVEEWMSKIRDEMKPLANRLAEKFAGINGRVASLNEVMDEDEKRGVDALTEKEKMDFEAAVLWKATLLYRLSCVHRLEGFSPVIHGDSGWAHLVERKHYRITPPLNYYGELPLFYNACKINFNATSLQMREAVNQRVFDVPACGAFLMTDYRQSLEELFEIGKEIVVFREKEEIPGLVECYLGNTAEREAIAAKGRERVLNEHTYKHRLTGMIRSMKQRYK